MSTRRKRRLSGAVPLDLIEEAVALLRRAPAAALLAYYLGAIPFWLGALYFVSDMSRNAYAAYHLTDWSLGLALLYVWKKSWQAFSAAKLRATLSGAPDAPWTARRVVRTIITQAAVQPWGLLLRPVAAVITLPFVWVAGFFQNVTVLGDGTPHAEGINVRAAAQAKLWPAQAHALVLVLFVFTIFVWLNVFAAMAAVPWLLKTFLGIETIYSRDMSAYLNTTFFAATFAITSLSVDPLRKALCVLRCFRGVSIHSGEDIAAELRAFSRAALAALVLVLSCAPSYSSDKSGKSDKSDSAELDRRIGEVLERREYAWRAPREKEPPAAAKQSWLRSWLDGAGRTIGRWVGAGFRQFGRFVRWLRGLFNPPSIPTPSGPSIDWVGLSKAVLVLLGSVLAGVLAVLLVRALRRRRKVVVATATAAFPDLRSEDVIADQLPEDGWLALAREHAARGELALALRAAWLACLAHLGEREMIRIARHKSNRDYERELHRRARDRQPLLDAFDDNRAAFERSWYGRHEVSARGFEAFQRNLDRIRQS